MARALDLHSRGQGFDSLILHGSPSRPPPRVGEKKNKQTREASPDPSQGGEKGKRGEKNVHCIDINTPAFLAPLLRRGGGRLSFRKLA